jgi:hypothetical protein
MGPSSWAASLAAACLCVAVWTAAGLAAEPDSIPSLTVVSRPTGALCRVRGDRMVVGATPLTLRGVSPGQYRVRAIDRGYERWERKVAVDGAGHDTVWMSLRERSAGRAALRSALVPGWGQSYSSRTVPAWFYATAATGLFGASMVAQVQYVDRADDARRATTIEAYEESIRRMEDARKLRNALQVTLAGVWAINVVDAAVFHRHRTSVPRAGLQLEPSGDLGSVRLAARIRF